MLELFITGVEQNKNKIFITSGLAATMQSLGYSCGVYKPVETGVKQKNGKYISNDLSYVKFLDPFINTYYSYQLENDLSPILSAAKEGLLMEKNTILKDYQKIQDRDECLIADGLSGLATPLSKNFLEEDIVKMLDMPILFVVSGKNTDISNILLSVNRAKELNIKINGIIINDYPYESDNAEIKMMPKLIEEYTGEQILGILPEINENINPEDLITVILNGIDIESVFKIKISKLS